MQQIEDLKNKARRWKDQLTKTPLELSLSEATSNENWNTSTKISQQIADASYGHDNCDTIVKYIWKRLHLEERDWRRILKTLTLIEYLIKNGAPQCVDQLREETYKIRAYLDFQIVEQGSDKGLSIRDKSKLVVELLGNQKLIEEERAKARQMKEKLSAINGAQAISGDPSYQINNSIIYNKPLFTEQNDKDKEYAREYGIYLTDNTHDGQRSGQGLDKYRSHKNDLSSPVQSDKQPQFHPQQMDNTIKEVKKPFQEAPNKLAKPNIEWSIPNSSLSRNDAIPNSQQQTNLNSQTSLIEFDYVETVDPNKSCQSEKLIDMNHLNWPDFSNQQKYPSQYVITQSVKDPCQQNQASQQSQQILERAHQVPAQYNQYPNPIAQQQQSQQPLQCSQTNQQTILPQNLSDSQSQNKQVTISQIENKLIDLTDLSKILKEQKKTSSDIQGPKQINQLHTTQFELDSIQLNYRHMEPQQQYQTYQYQINQGILPSLTTQPKQ